MPNDKNPREIELKVSLDSIVEAPENMTMEELEILKERCEDEPKTIIRSTEFWKKDGEDIRVCSKCAQLYANQDFEELTKRLIVCR